MASPRADGILTLQAAEDSVMVSYSFPAAVVKPGSYASLTACYSATSGYDRAWRKPNPNDFTVLPHTPHTLFTSIQILLQRRAGHVPHARL